MSQFYHNLSIWEVECSEEVTPIRVKANVFDTASSEA